MRVDERGDRQKATRGRVGRRRHRCDASVCKRDVDGRTGGSPIGRQKDNAGKPINHREKTHTSFVQAKGAIVIASDPRGKPGGKQSRATAAALRPLDCFVPLAALGVLAMTVQRDRKPAWIQARPSKSKPPQANPNKIAWICLVLFVRIGTYQWVTANSK